ncbi:hypothetical protein [Apilactobacillus xinyiensis]
MIIEYKKDMQANSLHAFFILLCPIILDISDISAFLLFKQVKKEAI